jgi:hypothetical protein
MALPYTNTTCDVYRVTNAPPGAPDVAGVKCYLVPRGQSTLTTSNYQYELWVAPDVDLRDNGAGDLGSTGGDKVYIPDKDGGVQYQVVLVRRHGRGTPLDHKRALLTRVSTNFPNDNV